jgi:short-subunit dehydrogenase
MATNDQLTAWLAEAETAFHQLSIGARVVTITSAAGKSVTYTATKSAELSAYIESLRRQLGLSNNRPMRPILG